MPLPSIRLSFTAARLCGPAVGAIFLMAGNPVWGFAVNAASYLLELYFLAQIKVTQGSARADRAGLKEAFVFAYGNARRRQVMVLLAVTTFFGVYIQLMPAFTAMRHGNALTNGFLIFASRNWRGGCLTTDRQQTVRRLTHRSAAAFSWLGRRYLCPVSCPLCRDQHGLALAFAHGAPSVSP